MTSGLYVGMLRRRRVWMGAAISAAFLALFLYRLDLGGMVAAIGSANYVYLLPAVGAYFVGVGFRTLRWRFLLQPVRTVPSHRLFSTIAVGYMANNILPARIGELVRAYVLGRREGISTSAVLATIVVERMFDGLALLALMGAVALTMPVDPALTDVIRIGGAFFVGFLVLFLAVARWPAVALRLSTTPLVLLPPALQARVRARFIAPLRAFLDGLSALRRPRALAAVAATSVLAWLAEAVMYYLVTFSFAIGKPFSVLIIMTAVANLGTTLPSGPGGLGTFDALAKWTLTLFGADPDAAGAYTIVLHAVLWLPITLVGLYYLWRENLSLAALQTPNR
ncbi:MAG: flippase-like domain-containing protein [Chloroflexi bacterium]|nr:flippase-like domain-containing protein [Chloroflexota bacterium]